MNLIQAVTEAIAKRGIATSEDIAPDFPDKTKEQIQRALANAAYTGKIRATQRSSGRGRALGRLPTEYTAIEQTPKKPKHVATTPAVNSVFHMAL